MPTLLSVNNYHYPRCGGCVAYLNHNDLFKRLVDWNVAHFSMQHPENFYTPWSKYFPTEIEFGRPYSIWEKMVRVPKTVYSFEARKNLDRLLNRLKPDVCHCHSIYHHISPAILSKLKQFGVPTVMTMHDLKLACPAYFMFNKGICESCKGGRVHNVLLRRCIKDSLVLSTIILMERLVHSVLKTYRHNVDRFVVPSRFYLKKMMEWEWNPEQMIYIPNFIDAIAYRPDFSVGKKFVYFGRLSSEKGLLTLIRAAAMANVPVSIIGDGPQKALLQKAAKKNCADIIFPGHLTGKNLQDAVRAARATVLPSEWYENAPMSILESYALGKPVIGADIGGIPELIHNGISGIFFKSGSVESLATVLRQVADTPDSSLAEMGRAGRKWVESNFSAKKYHDRITALYNDIGVRF